MGTWECGGGGGGGESCVILERKSSHREIVCERLQEAGEGLLLSFSHLTLSFFVFKYD